MTDQVDERATDRLTSQDGDLVLTYAEAAARTGLSVEALRQRAKRRRIRATKGNDGLIRVRLSPDEIDRLATGQPVGQSVGRLVGRLVTDQSDGTRPQAADTALEDARVRAAGAEGEVAALRVQVAYLADREQEARTLAERRSDELARERRELTAALVRTAMAETEARGLREALELAQRPAWRRWWGK